MKKLVLILAVLAAPAMAAVTLTLDNHGNADGVVDIKYTSTGTPLPRAFALNVSVDEGTITGYVDSTTDGTIQPFNVYMGNIQIDGGVIVDRGSPIAPDKAPDHPKQLGDASGTLVIEMGSLYDMSNPSDPCKPAASGILIRLICSSTATTCDMTVTSNALRGKIVNEDTTVEDRSVTGAVNGGGCYTGPQPAQWDLVGNPPGWCSSNIPRQCHGDTNNTAAGKQNYWVSNDDLAVLLAAWNKPYSLMVDINGDDLTTNGIPWINADFDHLPAGKQNYRVSNLDLGILLANWNQLNLPAPNCP